MRAIQPGWIMEVEAGGTRIGTSTGIGAFPITVVVPEPPHAPEPPRTRIGGEESAVLLPDTDVEGALALAERLRTAVEHHDSPDRAVTVSIGVATVRHASVGAAAALVREADRALYRSKIRGRNVVTHADLDGLAVLPSPA